MGKILDGAVIILVLMMAWTVLQYQDLIEAEIVAQYATAEYWSDLQLACSQWKAAETNR